MPIAVIGAGPAGALAATLLARGGHAVTLFEEKTFPRDKVCGECVSALGLDVLRRHGLLAPLDTTGRAITRAVIHAATTTATLALPSPMVGISRAALDGHLLDAARSAGATVRQPARVEGVEATAAVRLRVRDLSTNRVEEETFDHVFLADGRAALLGDRPHATGTIGIKTHYRNAAADAAAVTLYHTEGSYGGLAPIEGERWNAAFAVPASLLKAHAGDVDAAFAALVATNRRLAADLNGAARCSPWLAAPLPRYAVRGDRPRHITPIGNAAAAIEPIGGEGMGLAMRSAELAVDAILTNRLDALPSQYKHLWRRRSIACRLGGIALASEAGDFGNTLIGGSATISRAAMWAIGK